MKTKYDVDQSVLIEAKIKTIHILDKKTVSYDVYISALGRVCTIGENDICVARDDITLKPLKKAGDEK